MLDHLCCLVTCVLYRYHAEMSIPLTSLSCDRSSWLPLSAASGTPFDKMLEARGVPLDISPIHEAKEAVSLSGWHGMGSELNKPYEMPSSRLIEFYCCSQHGLLASCATQPFVSAFVHRFCSSTFCFADFISLLVVLCFISLLLLLCL